MGPRGPGMVAVRDARPDAVEVDDGERAVHLASRAIDPELGALFVAHDGGRAKEELRVHVEDAPVRRHDARPRENTQRRLGQGHDAAEQRALDFCGEGHAREGQKHRSSRGAALRKACGHRSSGSRSPLAPAIIGAT